MCHWSEVSRDVHFHDYAAVRQLRKKPFQTKQLMSVTDIMRLE